MTITGRCGRLLAVVAVSAGALLVTGCTHSTPSATPALASENPGQAPQPSSTSSSGPAAVSAPPPRTWPSLTFPPIRNLTLASVAAALPRSWRISQLTRDGDSYDGYVATTSTAMAGTQVKVGAVVTMAGSQYVGEVYCEFTRAGIKVDTALLHAARSCLDVAIPAADQPTATAWVNANAAKLPVGTIAKKSTNLSGLQVIVDCFRDTIEVLVTRPS